MLQDDVVAGPLRIDLRELETRSIRADGVELVRRAYFAVRDPAWGTVEPQILARELERHDGGFRLRAHCLYRADPIHVDARLEINATEDGVVRFGSTTVARSAFAYNRIGFCIHHPPAELAGAELLLDGTDTIRLPHQVLPQLRGGATFAPAAGPFSTLAIAGASGARVELRFSGDEFELEDQRNWTDGSFKTYGTPLAPGPPAPLAPGDRLTQSVEVRLLDPPRRRPSVRAGMPELRLAQAATTPRIGFATGSAPVDEELARLARPAHLRVDLREGRAALDGTIRRAAALGSGVQLALHLPLTDAERDDLRDVACEGRLRSVLVLHRDAELPTGPHDLAEVRSLLSAGRAEPRLWTGTDAYYAQLNRGLHAGIEGTCLTFSMHPQEHASDEESIVETLEIQRDVVLDLRAKRPGARVSLGAVTLGPRRSFSAPPGVAVADPAPDPRQAGLFGAAWSLASIRYLSEAGADEATYHALAGAGGLLAGEGRATPLLHLFADLAELGAATTLLESTAPLQCTGLAFRSAASLAMLVANLRAEPLRVRLPPAGDGRIRRLSEATLATATADPTSFRTGRDAWHGDVLELEPHEYVRLEVGQ
jgi:hypothetical protein